MRLYIKLTRNCEPIPFNYQHFLTGVVHKWIGSDNKEHGKESLYSFSWLQNTKSNNNGLELTKDSYFFISVYNPDLTRKIVKGILDEPSVFCGINVESVQMREVPEFSNTERFFLNSPILIKRKNGDQTIHITYNDAEFETLLTENLKNKLKAVNLPFEGVTLKKDRNYSSPQTKLVNYKGIQNKANMIPIIINGSPEQIAFAWTVGLGNSTGIGFGSIK